MDNYFSLLVLLLPLLLLVLLWPGNSLVGLLDSLQSSFFLLPPSSLPFLISPTSPSLPLIYLACSHAAQVLPTASPPSSPLSALPYSPPK